MHRQRVDPRGPEGFGEAHIDDFDHPCALVRTVGGATVAASEKALSQARTA